MVLVVSGVEVYNVDRYRKKALEEVSNPEMNVTRFAGAFTEEVAVQCNTFPFLSEKRAVLLECDTQKGLDNKDFEAYLQNPSKFCNLFIVLKKADSRTKLIKRLTSAGFFKSCDKFDDVHKVRQVLEYELKRREAVMSEAAMSEFLRRINYLSYEDMTLSYAVNLLDGCVAISKEITPEIVIKMVPEHREPNVFGLINLIKNKEVDKLTEEIALIPEDEAIGKMSLLLRSYRIAFKARFYKLGDIAKNARDEFPQMATEDLVRSMEIITDLIEGIKTGRVEQANALRLCAGKLCALI